MAPGSGDNQMSALGAGAVKEGAWVVSLGTSGEISVSGHAFVMLLVSSCASAA